MKLPGLDAAIPGTGDKIIVNEARRNLENTFLHAHVYVILPVKCNGWDEHKRIN